MDLIFESRIGCGVSSYIISKVLPNVQIRTFDLNDDRLIASKHSASSFLQDFCHNVETHVGDSLVLIPEYLEQFERGTVAILIDGPKGQIACDFAFRLFTTFDNIVLIGIHDTAPSWGYPPCTIPMTTKMDSFTADGIVVLDGSDQLTAKNEQFAAAVEGLMFDVKFGAGLTVFVRG